MGGDPLSGLQGHGVLSDPDGVGPWLEICVYRRAVSSKASSRSWPMHRGIHLAIFECPPGAM